MKKVILLISFIFSFLITGLAQSTIKGTLTDEETGKGISFANISIDQNKGTVSDESGKFTFENIKAGDYVLQISYVGYESLRRKINIKENEILELQIKLKSANITAEDVVITATKTENYIKDIPTRINLISPRQIEAIPAQTTDELLNLVPGINLNRSFGIFSHTTAVTMRGLNGQEQGRVLVMIDGIPTNKSDGG